MQTRCRCGRIGGTFAITFALISLLGLGGSIWLVFKNSNIVTLYKPATCSFRSVKESGWVMCHYCITAYVKSMRNGKQTTVSRLRCKVSRFPCVVVEVDYVGEDGFKNNGVIQDASSRHKFLKECSHSSCHAHPDDNKKEIDDFVMRWQNIPSRKCSYDPKEPRKVIGDSNLVYTLAIQGIIWSSLIFTASMTFMVVQCVRNHINFKRKMRRRDLECHSDSPWQLRTEDHLVVTELTTRVQVCQNGCIHSHREAQQQQPQQQQCTPEEVVPLSDINASPWQHRRSAIDITS